MNTINNGAAVRNFPQPGVNTHNDYNDEKANISELQAKGIKAMSGFKELEEKNAELRTLNDALSGDIIKQGKEVDTKKGKRSYATSIAFSVAGLILMAFAEFINVMKQIDGGDIEPGDVADIEPGDVVDDNNYDKQGNDAADAAVSAQVAADYDNYKNKPLTESEKQEIAKNDLEDAKGTKDISSRDILDAQSNLFGGMGASLLGLGAMLGGYTKYKNHQIKKENESISNNKSELLYREATIPNRSMSGSSTRTSEF